MFVADCTCFTCSFLFYYTVCILIAATWFGIINSYTPVLGCIHSIQTIAEKLRNSKLVSNDILL